MSKIEEQRIIIGTRASDLAEELIEVRKSQLEHRLAVLVEALQMID
jgi:hypothetical protein